MENPQLFIAQKPPAKTFAHGQGETGNANRSQAIDHIATKAQDFVSQFEDIERLHAEMYMNQFVEYLRERWGVKTVDPA